MAITPQTEIRLLKVPFGLDNRNQLTFNSKQAQTDYFLSLAHTTADNCTYQRKDNIIRYPSLVDNIINYNYVMYQNEAYSNKWFYAYITSIDYVNDNLSNIHIQTDVFQTWQFDLDYKPSFIEREHVNDDTIGANTVPEGLETGEYICNSKKQWLHTPTTLYNSSDMVVVLGATENFDGTDNGGGVETDGVYSGIRYYCFNYNPTGIAQLNNYISTYASKAASDAIKCLFMLPKIFTGSAADRADHLYAGSNQAVNFYINKEDSSNNTNLDFTNNNLDGYVPKNNKLLTYPFVYFICSNNNGSDVVFKYEDFYTKNNELKNIVTPSFRISSSLTPSGSARAIPRNYKGAEENDSEGINMGKFPICSWETDVYTNWLTQNGVNQPLQIASSIVSAGASLVTGNAVGVASGLIGIAQTLGEKYEQSLVPNQANGNINCGDVISATGKNDFIFYQMSIKNEYAKIIDNFFNMFGYKVNLVKKPNITGRQNWNYVKTIDANIEGDIPQDDLQTIKDIFNQGVTFWHNANTFLDYTQSNNIV